jgi:dTDP-glucose 4,6-dehydratase
MKNIIVTGGLGFIGFNFIEELLKKNSDYKIVCVDNITYAASYLLNEKLEFLKKNNIKIYEYSITDSDKIEDVIINEQIDTIVNFAAETHVDNSITRPNIFVETNIFGTQVLLELTRRYNLRLHQVSTDEVYGSVDPFKDVVTEDFMYNPSSPYSASKTSADLLCIAYAKTFGIDVTISRCTNNYGPYQHPEKLIPKVLTNALMNIKIPIYGDGKQIRNWIYVSDHCEGIIKILETTNYYKGEVFNIGSDVLIPNIDVVKQILNIAGKSEELIEFVKDRPAHDFAYHLCSDKIKSKLGWKEQKTFKEGIKETINFYCAQQ